MHTASQHPAYSERGKKFLFPVTALAFVCIAIFCVTIPIPRVDGKLIGSDGIYYYAITRSIVLDRDLNFANDYALLDVTLPTTATGLTSNPFAIGISLLWIPFFLLAHLISVAVNLLGIRIPVNGTGYVYEASICIGTILYASFGFFLLCRTLRLLFQEHYWPSFWSVFGVWWATPVIYYMVMEPSMSHGITVFSMSLFIFLWQHISMRSSWKHWIALGASAGLTALCRWQDGIVAVIPMVQIAVWLLQRRINPKDAARDIVSYLVMVVIVFLPQLIMWQIVYGAALTIPQGNDFIQWDTPHVIETLFSTRHGLMTWHPIVLLALLGIIPLWNINRMWAMLVLYMFFGEVYINSAVTRWWADDAFGGRRFTSLMPLIAIPLTAIGISGRWRNGWFAALIIALVIWNMLSLAQYRLGFVSKSEALTLQEMTIDRLMLPFELLMRVVR